MLTQKQRALLYYIHEKMRLDDVPPSFEEMKEALGLKSKSGIHRLISALVERGYIERLPHRARALEIKKLPESIGLGSRSKVRRNSSPSETNNPGMSTFDEIPLYGKIAAGTPIEALSTEGYSIALPQGLLGHGEHYALTIEGDSMVNAGILDGDTVVIKRCDTAENGAIVVALVDDQEATLKRLRRAGKKIVLEPENENYEPRIFEPDRVKVQGRLVHLMRRYDS